MVGAPGTLEDPHLDEITSDSPMRTSQGEGYSKHCPFQAFVKENHHPFFLINDKEGEEGAGPQFLENGNSPITTPPVPGSQGCCENNFSKALRRGYGDLLCARARAGPPHTLTPQPSRALGLFSPSTDEDPEAQSAAATPQRDRGIIRLWGDLMLLTSTD